MFWAGFADKSNYGRPYLICFVSLRTPISRFSYHFVSPLFRFISLHVATPAAMHVPIEPNTTIPYITKDCQIVW